jgi:hypothetical protein
MKQRDSTEVMWADGGIILKSITRKERVSQWTGLVWLRAESGPCNVSKTDSVD